jgi:hypothetical protein
MIENFSDAGKLYPDQKSILRKTLNGGLTCNLHHTKKSLGQKLYSNIICVVNSIFTIFKGQPGTPISRLAATDRRAAVGTLCVGRAVLIPSRTTNCQAMVSVAANLEIGAPEGTFVEVRRLSHV